MVYSSIDNKKIKDIKKLNQKKYRDIEGLFLIEGEHLVLEAYKSGYLECVILEENTSFDADCETMYVTDKVLRYISELDSPQKIMGICKKIDSNTIGNKVLILDGVQDPGNLGTIIRSVVAFSFDTIILSNNTVDLYNSKVVRASQGLLFYTNILIKDIKNTIIELKNDGYSIIGTKVDGGVDIKDINTSDKFALVMGNEGNGVSSDVLDLCDTYAYITMDKRCESLNVGVATSILLYELSK